MTARTRLIELDKETAELLEAKAKSRGLSIGELLTEMAALESDPSRDWESMRSAGRGPWSPEILAEDARRLASFERTGEGVPWSEVEAWMKSWGTPDELPPPKIRKL